MRAWPAVAVTVVTCTAATVGRAASPIAFRVESRTEAACPASRAFATELGARTARVRPAVGSEAAYDFSIEVSGASEGFMGRLRVRDPSGTTTLREVPGRSCPEIVSALALIAAILVDPDASTGPLSPAPHPAPTAPARPRWRLGVGVGAGLESAPTPAPAVAWSAHAILTQHRSVWIGLGVLHVPTVVAARASGDARFRWTSARLRGCFLRWPGSGPLAVRPCALLEAGSLHAAGQHTVNADEVDVPWLAAGLGLQLVAMPARAFAVVAEGAAVAPWRRDRFYFVPDRTDNLAFRVPAVGLSGQLGLVLFLL